MSIKMRVIFIKIYDQEARKHCRLVVWAVDWWMFVPLRGGGTDSVRHLNENASWQDVPVGRWTAWNGDFFRKLLWDNNCEAVCKLPNEIAVSGVLDSEARICTNSTFYATELSSHTNGMRQISWRRVIQASKKLINQQEFRKKKLLWFIRDRALITFSAVSSPFVSFFFFTQNALENCLLSVNVFTIPKSFQLK